MAEISILEFIVYGLGGYSGILLLISSAFKEVPSNQSQSALRSVWIIASIICIYMLANAGATINIDTVTSTIIDVNSTNVWTDTTEREIVLVQPVWITLHYLFFIMLIIYFIWNMLNFFVKRE